YMANIVLAMVDSRLIHGQTSLTWSKYAKANLIIAVNDDLAKDAIKQGLMNMAAPNFVDCRYFSVKKMIDVIDTATDDQKILVVCENLTDYVKLIDGGIKIDHIVVSRLEAKKSCQKISNQLCIDDEDIKSYQILKNKGVNVEFKELPNAESLVVSL
ncbi:MAG: PTS sugar transporter subunit IIB, partial [Erysipelotrichaceae bacterium]